MELLKFDVSFAVEYINKIRGNIEQILQILLF